MVDKNTLMALKNIQFYEPNPDYLNQDLIALGNYYTPIQRFFSNTSIDENEIPKKRGRKRLRPFNPTKTEVMDKF